MQSKGRSPGEGRSPFSQPEMGMQGGKKKLAAFWGLCIPAHSSLLLHRVRSSRSLIFLHVRAFETRGRSDLLTGLNTARGTFLPGISLSVSSSLLGTHSLIGMANSTLFSLLDYQCLHLGLSLLQPPFWS